MRAGFTLVAAIAINAPQAYAGDGTPVNSMSTIRIPATPTTEVINGVTINYGVGDNVQITNVTVGGLTLTRSAVSLPNISIKRKDNINVSGERLTYFYPGLVSGGNTVNIEGDQAFSMEDAVNDEYITSGGLDVFLNADTGVERANNIERIDFVVQNGIIMPSTPVLLSQVGTVANEKHGNNTYKIALITSLNAFGEPASYSSLKTIEGLVDYGNLGRPQNSSGTNLRNVYMRNGTAPVGNGTNGPVAYENRADTNFIGLSYISFDTLGATPNQVVYGYSLFPNDQFDSNDLVGLTDAPLNTSGGVNGGDIYGGTFAIFTTPAAEVEVEEGAPVLSGSKTVAMFDPGGTGDEYAIPGNDVIYTIEITNSGNASPDSDTMFLVDTLPSDVEFLNDDIDGPTGPETDPVAFSVNNSGLNFSYATDVKFSNQTPKPANEGDCTYTPVSGYDPLVKHICISPTGTFAHDPATTSFAVLFRTRIK